MAAQNLMPQCGSTQNTLHCGITKTSWTVATPTKNMLYRGRTKSPLQCGIIQTAALQQHKNTPRFGSRKNKNQKKNKKLMHCGNTHNTLHCNTIICYIVAAQQMRCTGAALDTRGTRNGGPKTMWHHKKQIQTTTTKKPSSLIAKKTKDTAALQLQLDKKHAALRRHKKPCCPVVAQKSKNKNNTKPCPAAAHKKHAALRQHKAKNPNMPPSGCTKNTHCTVAALKNHAALRQQKLKNCTLHCGCTRKMRHCDSTKKNAAQETESPKTIL